MAHHHQIGFCNPVSGADIDHIRCDWLATHFYPVYWQYFLIFCKCSMFFLTFSLIFNQKSSKFHLWGRLTGSKSTPSVVKSIPRWADRSEYLDPNSPSHGDIQTEYFCILNKNTTFSTLAAGCRQNPTEQKPTLERWQSRNQRWLRNRFCSTMTLRREFI